MDVSQKLKRIKHNLVNSTKRDGDNDIKSIAFLEARNAKIFNTISTYRKDLTATIKTGVKEENLEKRKKKLDEHTLSTNLKELSLELEGSRSTCLHKVMRKISDVVNIISEEKVKSDKNIEERVIDYLSTFQDIEKTMTKNKEKWVNSCTDLNIALKALEKEPTAAHQEAVDIAQLKMENLKDTSITDTYVLATREQEVAKVFATYVEEMYQHHRIAMTELQKLLPLIRNDIDNARPRPMFGVDLSEHLRHYNTRLSVVIEKCCTLLRKTGFTEKGLFRINGNNSKIRRMKAAFDCGQIDIDEKVFLNDPNSVCSTLKCYLRELPDPLLTNGLFTEWTTAIKLEGEARLRAFEQCIGKLPQSHFDNLTYLIHFLSDMLQHQHITAMNASNIAIVMGPNLLGSDLEGNNSVGTKVVETLLVNAPRFFGIPSGPTHVRIGSDDCTQPSTRNDSFRFSPGAASSPRMSRPKEKAPPPPEQEVGVGSLIDIGDNGSVTSINQLGVTNMSPVLSSPPDQMSPLAQFEASVQKPLGDFSDDSFDEYDDEQEAGVLVRNVCKPHRPPPPALRQGPVKARPMSYHMAVGGESPSTKQNVTSLSASPTPPQRNRTSMVVTNPLAAHSQLSAKTSSPSPVPAERSVGEATSASRPKPPLPVKPKPSDANEKETCRL